MLSLTLSISSLTAYCRNLPFGGRASEAHGYVFQGRETRGAATNVYFEENVRKTKRRSMNFKNKRLGSCLRIGKVLALHTPITKDDSL